MSLFNQYEAFTETARALSDEVEAVLRPIIDRYARDGALYREIGVVINSTADAIIAEAVVRKALVMRRLEHKKQ